MQNLQNVTNKFQKIRTFIRLELEMKYKKAFCQTNNITKGMKYNINEFVNLFNDNLIINFYNNINNEIDNGELLFEIIMNINKIVCDKFSENKISWKEVDIFFNYDNFFICRDNEFFLSLKNIQFIDYIQNINKNIITKIKIYIINQKNINNFIEIDEELDEIEFALYIYKFRRSYKLRI
jgi:hypothetical protein